MVAAKTWARAVIAVAAVASVGLMISPAAEESQTTDEAVYLASGLSYWRTNDYRLNLEHPPLIKRLLSLPAVLRGLPFTLDQAEWHEAKQWDIAPKVLFGQRLAGQQLLFEARLVNIALTAGLIVTAAWLSWIIWGPAVAALAAVMVAVEPNVLANGHLATTDVGYTLGILASVAVFLWWSRAPSNWRWLIVSLTVGLACLTRFSALALLLIVPAVAAAIIRTLAADHPLRRPRTAGRLVVVGLAVVIGLTWAMYGFEFRALDRPSDDVARAVIGPLADLALPAASFLSGAAWQLVHASEGQPAFLFGQSSATGWWYYFPMAMAVKMTVASLVFAGTGFIVFRKRWTRSLAPVVVTGAILLIFGCLSRLNIGVRYMLPVIVLLTMVGAAGAVWLWSRTRVWRVVVVLLVGWHVASVLIVSPHYLAYANEAFGGPSKLSRSLIDSNLDWGQDLPRLRAYLTERGITEYRFRSFSTAPAEAYGLVERDIPTDRDVAQEPFRGVIAISVSLLWYPTSEFRWLQSATPTDVVGHSINIYDFR